jgi:hypothetical protein
MSLSPTLRWLLGGLAASVAAFGALLPTLTGVPTWVGVAGAVLGAMFAALNIVPPGVGGTQQGVVSPSLKDQDGFSEVSFLLVLAGVAIGVVLVVYVF